MHIEEITSYGLVPVARVRIVDNTFDIEITNPSLVQNEKCIYAFIIGGQIVRIGSSKGRLAVRLRAWRNDVSKALQGRKSSTRPAEADAWRTLLNSHGHAVIYARPGTVVKTPIGEISAFLDEECELIERYRPSINWSWR